MCVYTYKGGTLLDLLFIECMLENVPKKECLGIESESEVTQSCPTLCDPMDYSLPGSSVRGIFQARVLEWFAISFSNAWKWKWSRVWLLAFPWNAAYQAPLSMGFSRQEYWSGLPLPSQNRNLVVLKKSQQKNSHSSWMCFNLIPCLLGSKLLPELSVWPWASKLNLINFCFLI